MWKTVARRLIIMIPQLIALTLGIFLLAELIPGDPLSGLLFEPGVSFERVQELRAMHGLDDPWFTRYIRWVGDMFRGDFGTSLAFQMPVLDVVGLRLPNTLRLSVFAVLILYIISVPLGIIAGRFNDKLPEKLISGYVYFGMAMPIIVFAFFLIWLFGFILGWFPMSGTLRAEVVGTGWLAENLNRLEHLVMPAMAISLTGSVGIVQFLRSEIVETRETDYVLTARSKGVPVNVIYNKHILRNSLLPIASSFGFVITGIFTGTIIVENLFGYNGMGRLFIESIQRRDMSVVFFLVFFYGILSVIGGLLSDIALTIFDPRIRIK